MKKLFFFIFLTLQNLSKRALSEAFAVSLSPLSPYKKSKTIFAKSSSSDPLRLGNGALFAIQRKKYNFRFRKEEREFAFFFAFVSRFSLSSLLALPVSLRSLRK